MDPRVKCIFRETNGHISAASNSALELVSGTWIVLMDHDDLMPSFALERVAEEIRRHPSARVFYSDEDKISDDGKFHSIYCKPDWNRDLFYSHNLISHLGVYHADVVRKVGGFRVGLEGSQDYDLALRVLEAVGDDAICHIPEILYHWRAHAESTASGYHVKPYVIRASERALNEHFLRIGSGGISSHNGRGSFRTKYPAPLNASVEFLLLYGGDRSALRKSINGICEECDALDWRVTVIPLSPSAGRQLRHVQQLADFGKHAGKVRFFEGCDGNLGQVINMAVAASTADFLHFTRESVRPEGTGWCEELISQASRSDIGAVVGLMLERDGRVDQCGLLLNPKYLFRGAFHHFYGDKPGYMGRLQVIQNFSAVGLTGLTISRSHYLLAGGLDADLKSHDCLGFDLSMKLRSSGLRNLYTPYARFRDIRRYQWAYGWMPGVLLGRGRDHQLMFARWGSQLTHDPCYGQNLDQQRMNFDCPSR